MLGVDWDYDARELRSLALVDRQHVGQRQFVQVTEVVLPTTVTKSVRPLTTTLRTAKPFLGLWKVTRSINPLRVSGISFDRKTRWVNPQCLG